MSWSAQTPQATGKDSLETAESYNEVVGGDDGSGTEQQFNAAMQAAAILAHAVGVADDMVVVNITGQANPGHAPEGKVDEQITISVRVERNRPAAETAASQSDAPEAAHEPADQLK